MFWGWCGDYLVDHIYTNWCSSFCDFLLTIFNITDLTEIENTVEYKFLQYSFVAQLRLVSHLPRNRCKWLEGFVVIYQNSGLNNVTRPTELDGVRWDTFCHCLSFLVSSHILLWIIFLLNISWLPIESVTIVYLIWIYLNHKAKKERNLSAAVNIWLFFSLLLCSKSQFLVKLIVF